MLIYCIKLNHALYLINYGISYNIRLTDFFFLPDSASVLESDSDDFALPADDLSKVHLVAG